MKAVQVRVHGGVDVLDTVSLPVPEVGPGEVLVQVKACALNHLDVWVRKGVAGHTFPLPLVLGSDVAGVVAALGAGVCDLALGDAVVVAPGVSCGVCARCVAGHDHMCASYAILGEHRDGGLAEYVCVPRANVCMKPKGCSYVEAASFGVAWLTAWHMLVERVGVRLGHTVLVQGASGGVGTAAVAIAKKWGARVVAATSKPSAVQRLLDLGADEVLLSSDPGMVSAVKALTRGQGVDVVVEHVGRATWMSSLKSLSRFGTVVTCGATTGADVSLQLQHLFFKHQTIMGSTMGSKGSFWDLMRHVENNVFQPVVDRVYGLDDVKKAHTLLESGGVFGKLVVSLE